MSSIRHTFRWLLDLRKDSNAENEASTRISRTLSKAASISQTLSNSVRRSTRLFYPAVDLAPTTPNKPDEPSMTRFQKAQRSRHHRLPVADVFNSSSKKAPQSVHFIAYDPALDYEISDNKVSVSKPSSRIRQGQAELIDTLLGPDAAKFGLDFLSLPSSFRATRHERQSKAQLKSIDIDKSPVKEQQPTGEKARPGFYWLPLLSPSRIALPPSPNGSPPMLKVLPKTSRYQESSTKSRRRLPQKLSKLATKSHPQEGSSRAIPLNHGSYETIHSHPGSLTTSPERPSMGSKKALDKARADRDVRHAALNAFDIETASDTESDPDLQLTRSPRRSIKRSSDDSMTAVPDNSIGELWKQPSRFRFWVEAIDKEPGYVPNELIENSSKHLSKSSGDSQNTDVDTENVMTSPRVPKFCNASESKNTKEEDALNGIGQNGIRKKPDTHELRPSTPPPRRMPYHCAAPCPSPDNSMKHTAQPLSPDILSKPSYPVLADDMKHTLEPLTLRIPLDFLDPAFIDEMKYSAKPLRAVKGGMLSANETAKPFNAARLPDFGQSPTQTRRLLPIGHKHSKQAKHQAVRNRPALAAISGNEGKSLSHDAQSINKEKEPPIPREEENYSITSEKHELERALALNHLPINGIDLHWAANAGIIGFADPKTPLPERMPAETLNGTIKNRSPTAAALSTPNTEDTTSETSDSTIEKESVKSSTTAILNRESTTSMNKPSVAHDPMIRNDEHVLATYHPWTQVPREARTWVREVCSSDDDDSIEELCEFFAASPRPEHYLQQLYLPELTSSSASSEVDPNDAMLKAIDSGALILKNPRDFNVDQVKEWYNNWMNASFMYEGQVGIQVDHKKMPYGVAEDESTSVADCFKRLMSGIKTSVKYTEKYAEVKRRGDERCAADIKAWKEAKEAEQAEAKAKPETETETQLLEVVEARNGQHILGNGVENGKAENGEHAVGNEYEVEARNGEHALVNGVENGGHAVGSGIENGVSNGAENGESNGSLGQLLEVDEDSEESEDDNSDFVYTPFEGREDRSRMQDEME